MNLYSRPCSRQINEHSSRLQFPFSIYLVSDITWSEGTNFSISEATLLYNNRSSSLNVSDSKAVAR